MTLSLLQNTRIRANFGARPFMYAEGTQHRKAADECHDVTQDIKDTFVALPFHFDSDSDDAASSSVTNSDSGSRGELRASPGLPCRTAMIPKSLRGMSADYLVFNYFSGPIQFVLYGAKLPEVAEML